MTVGRIFTKKYIYLYIIILGFFQKHEKLGSHTRSKWWPGDPDVKNDPNDPLTRWPNDPVPCLVAARLYADMYWWRRRAQANARAASHWLRRVIDDDERRGWTSPSVVKRVPGAESATHYCLFSGVLRWACLSACLFLCLSVCLSVRERISGSTHPIFIPNFFACCHGRGPVLLWWRCCTLCASGFINDVFHSE